MTTNNESKYTKETAEALRQACLETGVAISKIAAERGLKQSSTSRMMKKFGVAVPRVAEIQQYQAEHGIPVVEPAPTPAPTADAKETVKRKSKKAQ